MTSLLLTFVVLSGTTEPAASISYEAPSGCPSESEFFDAVTARGGDLSSPSLAAPRVLKVSIQKQTAGFGGAFQVQDQRGATGKRHIKGRSCTEVADALAVVTAIELQAENDGTRDAATPPPPSSDPPPPPASTPSAPATDPPPDDDRLRGNTRIFAPRTETLRVGPGALRFDLSQGIGVDAGATAGLIPSTILPTYSLRTLQAHFVTTPEGVQRIAGLVLGLHADFLGNGTYSSPDTRTVARGTAVGIDLCQAPVYDSRGPILLVCGELGGGYLNLETKGLDGTMMQSKSAGFGTAAAVVGLQYNFSRHIYVDARVVGGFKLGDVTAERADGSRIFGSSFWFASATLGVGWRY
jgi:hypothetical protein